MNFHPNEYLFILDHAFRKQYGEQTDEWTNDPQLRVFPAFIQGQLNLPLTTSALDIGCGAGYDAEYFANIYANVVGVDIYEHANWTNILERKPNVYFERVDFLSYSRPQTFDLILDNGCFHHQHEKSFAPYLRKISDLMSKGGYFSLSTFKNPKAQTFLDANGRIHHYFSDTELHLILGNYGFKVIAEYSIYRVKQRDFYRLTYCRHSGSFTE
jgi:SAM-dependent methyltransferase